MSDPRERLLEPHPDETGSAEDSFAVLRGSALFDSLSDDDLRALVPVIRKIEVRAGDFVMREGEPGRDVFILKEGEVQILKREGRGGSLHEIARAGQGASVGELALLDDGPRSASVRALRPTTLYALSPQQVVLTGGRSEVLRQLSRALAARLRFTNEVTVRLLHQQVAMARFIAFLVFSLSLYAFALSVMTRYASEAASSTLVTVSLMLVMTGAVLNVIRRLGFPMGFYGLTLAGWRRAVGESLLVSVVVCVLIVGLKWLILHAGLRSGHVLFEPHAAVNAAVSAQSPASLWLAMVALYALHAPFQEFLVRGCLQGALQQFLGGTYRQSVAIVGSNLIFASFHLYLSLGFALVTFIPGVLWGWLYRRHGTLVGVAISHVIVGLWAVFVVGIEGILF